MEAMHSSKPSLRISIQGAASHKIQIFDNLLLETAREEKLGYFSAIEWASCGRNTRGYVMIA